MRIQLISVLIVGGYAVLCSSDVQTSDPERQKRSALKNRLNFLHSRFHNVPSKTRVMPGKRSFDTLDLDLLLSDPFFAEMERGQKQDKQPQQMADFTTFNDIDFAGDSQHAAGNGEFNDLPHEATDDMADRLQENLLDLDNFQHLPDLTGSYDGLNELPKIKDEMSNIIPGAQGPFDAQPGQERFGYGGYSPQGQYFAPPPPAHAQRITDAMMDDFLEFLFLRETGMLNQCLGYRRRRK